MLEIQRPEGFQVTPNIVQLDGHISMNCEVESDVNQEVTITYEIHHDNVEFTQGNSYSKQEQMSEGINQVTEFNTLIDTGLEESTFIDISITVQGMGADADTDSITVHPKT